MQGDQTGSGDNIAVEAGGLGSVARKVTWRQKTREMFGGENVLGLGARKQEQGTDSRLRDPQKTSLPSAELCSL